MAHDVFISYSSKNKNTADAICHVLEEHKIRCWIAPRNIEVGEKYGNVIEQAIRNSKIFIIVFSKESSISPWVESELNIAFTDRKIIMPFKIDDTILEGEMRLILNNKHWIDAYPEPEKCFHSLYESVARQLGIDLKKIQSEKKMSNEEELRLEIARLKAEKDCIQQELNDSRKSKETVNDKYNPDLQFNHVIEQPKNIRKDIIKSQDFTETVNGVSFDMIYVEGGTFMMGSPENEIGRGRDEKLHKVTLSDFYIGRLIVTQSLWFAVMNKNNNYNKNDCSPKSLSWCNCEKFLERLNLLTGRRYCLPTEAQWEYAARGGQLSQRFIYAGTNNINEVACYEDGIYSVYNEYHIPSMSNELGILNMCGNVWEWCQDWYGDYLDCEIINPKGPDSGSKRVRRGGSKSSSEQHCRIAVRRASIPTESYYNFGFRLALLSE